MVYSWALPVSTKTPAPFQIATSQFMTTYNIDKNTLLSEATEYNLTEFMLSDSALKMAEWAWWVATLTAKAGANVALNAALPGLGSIMDFGEGLYEFSQGNMTSGFINVGFGVFNLVTVGLAKSATEGVKASFKTAAKSAGVNAVKNEAKVTVEELTKKFGPEIVKKAKKELGDRYAKELAQGIPAIIFEKMLGESGKMTVKKAEQNLFMSIISAGGHKAEGAIIQSLLESQFTYIFEIAPAMFKAREKDIILSATMKATKEVAEEKIKKLAWKHLSLNYGCAITKGCINTMTTQSLTPKRE